MWDQQDLSDCLSKIVLWVVLVLNLRTNGSNVVLNKASGFMGSCGRKTFYFKFPSIQKLCLLTEPFSLLLGGKTFFTSFIACCQNNVVQGMPHDLQDQHSPLLGCYAERVGLGVVTGVCVALGRAGITSICFAKRPTKLCLRRYGHGGRSLLCCLILKLLQLYMHIPCLNVASQ